MSFEPVDVVRHILDEVVYLREAPPEIDSCGMAGMRDRLIHGYLRVDLELVWDVVRTRVPELDRRLRPLIAG